MSRGVQANGVEAWVLDNQDFFLRNVVAVAAGVRTNNGLLIERVEPMRVEELPVEDGLTDPVTPPLHRVEWMMTQRLITDGDSLRYSDAIEHDPVVVRVHRNHALAVGTALVQWATGQDPGTAGELARVRADLERERDRADRLEAALLEVTSRLTPIVSGQHSLVPVKVPPS